MFENKNELKKGELKGMLCETLFFLFFLVLTFHFFPYGTKKGGRRFKPLSQGGADTDLAYP